MVLLAGVALVLAVRAYQAGHSPLSVPVFACCGIGSIFVMHAMFWLWLKVQLGNPTSSISDYGAWDRLIGNIVVPIGLLATMAALSWWDRTRRPGNQD